MRPYELECVHGVGHSAGVHGCDGCCRIIGIPAKAEAWDEGHWEGWQNAREALLTDMFGGPTLNPYREEKK